MLILSAVLIAGCTQFSPCIEGSGNVVSETRTVEPFHSVDLATVGTVYLTQDATASLQIEAEENILPLLRTRVTDGVLTIDHNGQCFRTTQPIIIRLTTDEVRRVSVSGSGSVVGENEILSENLETGVSGSGGIDLRVNVTDLASAIVGSGSTTLQGTATDHTAVVSGSGKVAAFDLETRGSTVTIEGSGTAEVFATEVLDVTVSGSGTVTYRGSPAHITQEVTGSGGLVHAG
ncbi:head GIN domain-containing protein [Methanofollis ethanolicus]|uniref:head GIN domain-containing protein n=1 Tax=Methanofollis ethanolicus TaxID=488124 RepID=UPI0009F9FA1E|nr:head GIN domain-containing protein [Methanofollis ethanolicus]